MTLSLGMITLDTTDALTLARWWADQVGGTVTQENDGWFVVVECGDGSPMLAFQKVDAPTPGKNRMHLDLSAPDLEGEVARLVEAGATLIGDRSEGGMRWFTMADPDGNEFDVAAQA